MFISITVSNYTKRFRVTEYSWSKWVLTEAKFIAARPSFCMQSINYDQLTIDVNLQNTSSFYFCLWPNMPIANALKVAVSQYLMWQTIMITLCMIL